MDDLLRDLTPPQREAVVHVEGPLLIIAAAGSGKTRVITRRVAHLLRSGVEPAGVLAITFTNKAAGEMKQRISAISPKPIRDWGRLEQPWPIICTFHSLCLRILRHYADAIGLPANFSIFDSADQNRLIKEAIKAVDLSSTNFTPASVHGAISNAKNKLIDAKSFAEGAGDFYARAVARIYTKYQQLLTANNAMDFDDLLMKATMAMRDFPAILAELQERFQYILIDEYQDTNHAQYILAHALALKHRNLCVVGDPDQSIYAWRGADVGNILDFEKDYPDATVVRLEQNYRSTKTILAIAEKLISHNQRRKEKRLWTENPRGEKAKVFLCHDEHDEAKAITAELQELGRSGVPWSKMAIFYRMNSLSRVMEDALRRAGVPYQIARGIEFYGRKEIKDVLAYLRLIANPADEVSLGRIINVPTRGIGDSSLKLVEANAISQGISLWEMLKQTGSVEGISSRAQNAMNHFVQMIDKFQARAALPVEQENLPPGKGRVQSLMEEVVRVSGLEAMLRKEDPDGENELANVNELISAASEYDAEHPEGSLTDYLAAVSLVSDADHLAGAGGSVTLMTLHAAKGLEFPVVAMIGLEEGCLPHARAQENPDELEEERRLCFVGITRAQERLILSKAAYRTIRGLRERTATSQFLAQVPQEFLTVIDRVGTTSFGQEFESSGEEDSGRESSLVDQYRIGQRVRHPSFGIGRILGLPNSASGARAVVQFERAGLKTLILEHAKLTPA
jgi:DNA helicase II / ATP-dependent DNA helicase PcrA